MCSVPADLPLDDEQRAAVDTAESAIAVLAGPGSGKTRVLSYRARRLLMIAPRDRVLMLTFTNKAAAEMKARALGVSVVASDRIWGGTFHTFGLHVLQSHGDLIGVGREFEVIDDEEREEVVAEATRTGRVSDRFRQWSRSRLRRRRPPNAEVIRFGQIYEETKRALNVVDFDDLVVYTADLLQQYPEVARAYSSRYPHLLVDEFQDTNAAQFAIIQSLAAAARTISVFADDDQAIYRFAGAEAENIRRFIGGLDAREYPLAINYRCRRRIVDCADRLIAADPFASGRRMLAVKDGGYVRSLTFDSVDAEAAALVGEIDHMVGDGGVSPHEIAVLTRAAFRVETLLHELERRGLPVNNWLGQTAEAEDRKVLRTCLSAVRGPLNDRQARRLCELLRVKDSGERDPERLLRQHSDNRAAVLLLEMRILAWNGAAPHAVVVKAHAAISAVDPAVARAMGPFVDVVAGFQNYDPEFSLQHVLAELTLGAATGPPTAGGGVKVSSLHRTKGLQWPHVYIVGMEEGRLPGFRARTSEEISEERRVCFVGVCRAEDTLTLTRVRRDRRWEQRPSRFLGEMEVL
jgi:DNA helicase II / ATP-dependent DNA helicase PcrA